MTDHPLCLAMYHIRWRPLPTPRGAFIAFVALFFANTSAAVAGPIVQIQTSYDSHKCLDIFRGSTQPNYGVDLFNCNPGDPHESFAFQKLAGGTYTIVPQSGGTLCLDANGIDGPGGTQLIQNACSGSRSQEWNLHENTDGTFSILTADGTGTIEVQGERPTANRTPILVSSPANALESRFYLPGFKTENQAHSAPAADGDRTIGPGYYSDPYLTPRPDVPKGRVIAFTMKSTESRIFPGNAEVTGPYTRAVWVYVPHQYVKGTAIPFMVSQDAAYRPLLPALMDNAIHDKKLPVMVIVFANSGGGGKGIGIAHDQGTERNLEYDTVSRATATG